MSHAQSNPKANALTLRGEEIVAQGSPILPASPAMREIADRDRIERFMRTIPPIKERLHINVELAAPLDFIPIRPDWADRSPFIEQVGSMAFRHFDLYAQALSKIERRQVRDVQDVNAMLDRGLIDIERLKEYFAAVEPMLYRYPAIDPGVFRSAVEACIEGRA